MEKNRLILHAGLMMIISFAVITNHKPLLHNIGDSTYAIEQRNMGLG